MRNEWLLAGGVLSGLASIVHLACIAGGPSWYRFFGAGERMARLAERGAVEPALITLAIAGLLALWSAYALSGAGVIGRLPLLRPALVLITVVYLGRAAALPAMLIHLPDRGSSFLIWSSLIVLLFGLIHLIGLVTSWARLSA